MTTVLIAQATCLTLGSTHTFEFKISDKGDSVLGSGVFIEAGTFSSSNPVPEPAGIAPFGLRFLMAPMPPIFAILSAHYQEQVMAIEIERKFLVQGDAWKAAAVGVLYRQGYLSTDKARTVRVRIAGERAFLTVKGLATGLARAEFEYEIPLADAAAMLDQLCMKPLIEKRRYTLDCQGMCWEVDEFLGDNLGLVVAEVELERADQEIDVPDWVGQEVSDDARYFNSSLIVHPFSSW